MQVDDADHATDSVDSEEPEEEKDSGHVVLEIHDGFIEANSFLAGYDHD